MKTPSRLYVVTLLLIITILAVPASAYDGLMYERVLPPPISGAVILDLDWSPDGRFIAVSYYTTSSTSRGFAVINATNMSIISLVNYEPVIGYTGTVNSVSWSPDGSKLAVTMGTRYGYGGVMVYDFDPVEGDLTPAWWIIAPGPRMASWSHDGSKIAMVFDYYSTSPYNLLVLNANGTPIFQQKIGEYLWTVSWSPDDQLLIVGSRTLSSASIGYIHVFNTSTWEEILSIQTGWVRSAIILGEPPRIYAAGDFGTIQVYDLNGTLVNETPWMGDIVNELTPLDDGRILVSVLAQGRLSTPGGKGRLVLVDQNLDIVWEKRYCTSTVQSAKIGPEGWYAWGGGDGALHIVTKHGAILWESSPLPGTPNTVTRLGGLAAAGGDGWVGLYSSEGTVWETRTYPGNVTHLQAGPYGILVASKTPTGSTIELLGGNGTSVWSITLDNITVTSLHASPVDRLAFAGTSTGEILVISLNGGTLKDRLAIAGAEIAFLSWDPIHRVLAISTSDGLVKLYHYEVSTGDLTSVLALPSTPSTPVSLNPVAMLVAFHAMGEVRVHHYYDGGLYWSINVSTVPESLSWSPDGSKLALSTGGSLEVYSHDGIPLFTSCTFNTTLRSPASFTSLSWSPDSNTITLATIGSAWLTTVYAGPYPPPRPLVNALVGGTATVSIASFPSMASLLGLALLAIVAARRACD